jgi:hypothetical protein
MFLNSAGFPYQMNDNKLSGSHVYRTLAFLAIPTFRSKYLSSLYTDEQREWAKQVLHDYESGQLKNLTLVPEQDSICARCFPFRQSECTYKVEPIAFNQKEYPFGTTSIEELLKNFDPVSFLKKEEQEEQLFYQELMLAM